MSKTITVDILPDGTTTVDLDGFEGQGCSAVIDAFAGKDAPREYKREYSEEASEQQQQRAGAR